MKNNQWVAVDPQPVHSGDIKAEEGEIWVCGACGKTSSTRYGLDSRGWDASCILNSVLCWNLESNEKST